VIKRPVGQALSDDAFQGAISAGNVVYAQLDPVSVPEIELGSRKRKKAMRRVFLRHRDR